MKKSLYSEKQIVFVFKQREMGSTVANLYRVNGLGRGAQGRSGAHPAWPADLERACGEHPRVTVRRLS
jgi:hypothetical protein